MDHWHKRAVDLVDDEIATISRWALAPVFGQATAARILSLHPCYSCMVAFSEKNRNDLAISLSPLFSRHSPLSAE